MTEVNRLPIAPRIEEEAAAWVARHDSGPLDEASAAKFQAWYVASPAHEEAFRQYSHLWAEFDHLASTPSESMAANDHGAFWLRRRAIASAAALFLLVAGTLVTLRINADPRFETMVGEQSVVTLVDGSRISLNTGTALSAHLSRDDRVISLEYGEALFEVAHDPSRPFIVKSPRGSVRAVGTKFVVSDYGQDGLEVVVTEGKVLVDPDLPGFAGGKASARSIALTAGQKLRSRGLKLAVANRAPDELARELAWRQGDVLFKGESLAEAAAEMQRYTGTKIDVAPDVAHYSIGGYFRTNDLDTFVETIEILFPVHAVRGRDEIRLVAK